MGGEKDIAPVSPIGVSGSPPHGRGKGVSNVLVPEKFGITPAWAGKSRYRCRCWSGGRDHPRMGGEKVLPEIAVSCAVGSPPRRRGKETRPDIYRQLSRITPARAGKRLTAQSQTSAMAGSPPHGRGKAAGEGPAVCAAGITPAWARKRARRPSWSYGGGDHPRMGGEKSPGRALRCCIRGSPPRGRGKEPCFGDCLRFAGITPAWAGKRKIQHRIHSQ